VTQKRRTSHGGGKYRKFERKNKSGKTYRVKERMKASLTVRGRRMLLELTRKGRERYDMPQYSRERSS